METQVDSPSYVAEKVTKEIFSIARSLNEVREKTQPSFSPFALVEDQGGHLQAAENFAEPAG